MKFVDLFCGLGGFHLAAKAIGLKCVFASEKDDYLRKLYFENFGILPSGDIRKVSIHEIPKHELLCAGFPCQPFSKAGDQLGWGDKQRGTLFLNITEILKIHQPQFFILENVANFLRHDDGKTYELAKNRLESMGYFVKAQILSPHQFGIPQIRERVYIVGSLDRLDNFSWPEDRKCSLSIKNILDENPKEAIPLSVNKIKCLEIWQNFISKFPENLPSFPIWSMEFGADYPYDLGYINKLELQRLRGCKGSFGQSLNFHKRLNIYNGLPTYALNDDFPSWKRKFIQQNRDLYNANKSWLSKWIVSIQDFPPSLQKFEWNSKGGEKVIWNYIIQFRASGVRIKKPTTSPSLVAMTSSQVPVIGWEKRYMTVQECARLQSMESLKYLPAKGKAVSALGNAVNAKVVQEVLEKLLSS